MRVPVDASQPIKDLSSRFVGKQARSCVAANNCTQRKKKAREKREEKGIIDGIDERVESTMSSPKRREDFRTTMERNQMARILLVFWLFFWLIFPIHWVLLGGPGVSPQSGRDRVRGKGGIQESPTSEKPDDFRLFQLFCCKLSTMKHSA